VIALLARVTGVQALINLRHRLQDKARAALHRRQRDALQRRHDRELLDLKRHDRALKSIEAREMRSLATALRREHLLMVVRERLEKDSVPGKEPPGEDRTADRDRGGGGTSKGSGERTGGAVPEIPSEPLPPGLKERAKLNRRQREKDKSRGKDRGRERER